MGTRTPVALLLALLLVAACGVGRTQADQERDAGLVAGALRAAWIDGTGFTLDHQLQLAGGDIPRSRARRRCDIRASVARRRKRSRSTASTTGARIR